MGSIRPLSDGGGRSTVQEGNFCFLDFWLFFFCFILSIWWRRKTHTLLSYIWNVALWLNNLLLLFIVKQPLNVFSEYGRSEWFMSSKFQGQSKIGFAKTLFWSLLRVQLFAWSLDKNAAAIGGASKPLSTVFSVVYPIWKVAGSNSSSSRNRSTSNRNSSSGSCRNGSRNGNSSRLTRLWNSFLREQGDPTT